MSGFSALGGLLNSSTVKVSPAQIKTLSQNGVQLLSNPGPGFANIVLYLLASLEFGTTLYTEPNETAGTAEAAIFYESSLGPPAAGSILLDDSLGELLTSPQVPSSSGGGSGGTSRVPGDALKVLDLGIGLPGTTLIFASQQIENAALVLGNRQGQSVNGAADFLNGDSSLLLTIVFLTVPLYAG